MNFTKAAQNLFVAQSALSRQIQMLETELGVTLVLRTNRNVLLTEAGEIFRDRSEKLMADMEKMTRDVRAAGSEKKEIRIGIFPGLSSNNLFRLMRKLKDYFCGYDIILNTYKTVDLMKAFDKGEIDIAMTVEEIALSGDKTENRWKVLQTLPAYIICSRELFDGNEETFCLDRFNDLELIYSSDPYTQKLADRQKEIASNIGKKIACKAADNVIVEMMYSEPQGFLIYFNRQLETDLLNYELPEKYGKFQLYAYWKKNNRLLLDRFFDQYN